MEYCVHGDKSAHTAQGMPPLTAGGQGSCTPELANSKHRRLGRTLW